MVFLRQARDVEKVALITGGSRGIGRGIVLALASAGYSVVVNYAGNQEAARETCELAKGVSDGIQALPIQGNVGLAADRSKLLEATRSEFGRLDLLVNNAGITSIGRSDLLEATEANMDTLMAVNLKGPFFLSQKAAKWMIEQGQNDGESPPKIVNISSISRYTVSTNRADYCMGKAALSMLTKLFAVRLAEHGIGVFEVCPGVVRSDMTAPVTEKYDRLIAEGLTPIPRWGEPDDVGRAVVAIATDQFPFSTGEVINVDGGFHLRTL